MDRVIAEEVSLLALRQIREVVVTEDERSMMGIVMSDLLTSLPEDVHAAKEFINCMVVFVEFGDVASEEVLRLVEVMRVRPSCSQQREE